MEQMTMEVMAEIKLAVDFKHVVDISEIDCME